MTTYASQPPVKNWVNMCISNELPCSISIASENIPIYLVTKNEMILKIIV